MDFHRWVHFPIIRIAELLKLKIRGWINYYGKFRMSEMRKVFRLLHIRLGQMDTQQIPEVQETTLGQGIQVFAEPITSYPNLFEHWQYEGFRP
jgi:RNA-directed DNA polymerase